jgi:hypothetical protein
MRDISWVHPCSVLLINSIIIGRKSFILKAMARKILLWLVVVVPGAVILWFASQNALGTETDYFTKLLLSNNRELALLISGHFVDDLKEVKNEMEGFSRLCIKEGFDSDKLKAYLRYQYDGHDFVSAIRFLNIKTGKWDVFYNSSMPLYSESFFRSFKPEYAAGVLKRGRDFFTEPYFYKDEAYASRFQIIRDRRKNEVYGVIELQVSIHKLLASSKVVPDQDRERVFLLDHKGTVIYPKLDIMKFSDEELQTMKSSGMGGFDRISDEQVELLAYCSMRVLEPVNVPGWILIFMEGPEQLTSFEHRMGWNIYSIFAVGVFCLMFLTRLLVFRG